MPRPWLLWLSISVNLFLAGLVVGQMLSPQSHRPSGPPHGPHGPPSPMHMAEEIARTLPPADGEILRAAFAAQAAAAHGTLPGPGDGMERIQKILTAPDYDAAALAAALTEFHHNHQIADHIIGAALLDAAGRMSPEGRRKLGEWGPPPPPNR